MPQDPSGWQNLITVITPQLVSHISPHFLLAHKSVVSPELNHRSLAKSCFEIWIIKFLLFRTRNKVSYRIAQVFFLGLDCHLLNWNKYKSKLYIRL